MDNIADAALTLHRNWLNTIGDSLREPEMIKQVGYLDQAQQARVQQFLNAHGSVPDGVTHLMLVA